MFDPPEELHTRFEAALDKVKANLGKEHAMIIAGEDQFSEEKVRRPLSGQYGRGVGGFPKRHAAEMRTGPGRGAQGFPVWSGMKWQDRVALLRKAADLIDERIFEIGAAMAMEVGKNRMESLGDVAETADLIRYSCYQMEKNDGYIVEMGRDPLVGYTPPISRSCAPTGSGW
jgi:1-pyrroline-5-carboxylate dehydrogenase